MKRIEKVEMLLGKGILCLLGIAIALGLFTLLCFLLNWLVTTMLNNFWLTFSFVVIDVLLITKELHSFDKAMKKNKKNF